MLKYLLTCLFLIVSSAAQADHIPCNGIERDVANYKYYAEKNHSKMKVWALTGLAFGSATYAIYVAKPNTVVISLFDKEECATRLPPRGDLYMVRPLNPTIAENITRSKLVFSNTDVHLGIMGPKL